MTYKESAMTTTSDNMPETSQMTRNNTITDFDQSDSEYHSPNVHKDSLLVGSGAGSDDHIINIEYQLNPSLQIKPLTPGHSFATNEIESPMSLSEPDGAIDRGVSDSESDNLSYPELKRGMDPEHSTSSTELSVEVVFKLGTSRSLMSVIEELAQLKKKKASGPKKWQETGIWALIRHQLALDRISIRRRSGIGFERASKAFYVDHPKIDFEMESDSESLLLSGTSRTCCPQEGNLVQKIYQVFDRSDTWTGALIAFLIMAFIILSLVCMCMESLPAYRFPNYGDNPEDIAPIFDTLEIICVSVFTVEYAARIYSAGWVSWEDLGTLPPPHEQDTPFRKRLFFFRGVLNMIDFLAIVPFYLEILTDSSGLSGSLTILRLLRLLRVLRLFKLGRHVQSVRMYANVISTVAPALVILLLFLTFLWVIGSSLMYIAESGKWDENFEVPGTDRVGAFTRYSVPDDEMITTNFESVFHSLWWAIMTYSLVGYGEIVPTSFLGYGIGIIFMIFGIVGLSLPIGLVATTFIDVNEHYYHNIIHKADFSRRIIEMCEEGRAKCDELETLLENIMRKFDKRHGNVGMIEHTVRSYDDVLKFEREEG